jgi:hypothetical protein
MGDEGNEMKTVRNWLKKLSSANHRRADRMESPMLLAYYWDGSIPEGHEIRNISSTGFYLVAAQRWLPGTVITMTLQRTDISDATSNPEGYITVLSKVIRVDKDGVGLVFLPVAENNGANGRTRGAISKKAICRFLEHLKSEKGHAIVGYTAENLDTENLDTENLDTENQEMNVIGPGNKFGRAWRRRYEKTYG